MGKKKKLKRPAGLSTKQKEAARAIVAPPVEREGEEVRFKKVVQQILDEGLYPGPTLVNTMLGKPPGKRGMRNFSGRESQWRSEVFQDNGWVYVGDPQGRTPGRHQTWISKEEHERVRALLRKRQPARRAARTRAGAR